MVDDDLKRDQEVNPSHKSVDWELCFILTLAAIALVVPYVSIPFVGLYWAAAVAIAVWFIWGCLMPTSCMNGGLLFALLAMVILANTTCILLAATIQFTISLFF